MKPKPTPQPTAKTETATTLEKEPVQGLLVTILRPASLGDCTNHGVTAPNSERRFVYLFDPSIRGNVTLDEIADRPDCVALKLVRRWAGTDQEYLHAEPFEAADPSTHAGPMVGGNFIYSSDSRFRDVSPYPIAVHDRFDTWSDHEAMSR